MSYLPAAVALVTAMFLGIVGLTRGTWAVGGSDSSCYALMADAFAHGSLQPVTALAREAPWPDAPRTFAPAGFIPSPIDASAASPICAPGFALLLAPFLWVGGADAIFIVTALAGAVLIWLTFVFTTRLAGPVAGAAAAVIVATTPIVLFQVMQPMNDITVAALWMGVLVAATTRGPRRSWWLGTLTGLAILVRPNLAPAAAVVGLWLIAAGATADDPQPATAGAVVVDERPDRPPATAANGATGMTRRLAAFAIGGAPFALILIWLNIALYGHALQSGYGSTADLFSLQHMLPNVRQYGRALIETQLGLPLLGLMAIRSVRGPARSAIGLALAISASVVAVYLLYRPFPEWWYLRFFLPALVPMTALAVAAVAGAAAALSRDPRFTSRATTAVNQRRFSLAATLLIAAATAVMAIYGVTTARERQAFDLQRLERRFRLTGELARDRLPANGVFLTIWESGTVRFHAGRTPVLWDSLDPSELERAIAWLTARGLDPYILIERWEESQFRARFAAHSPLGDLDWPPRFDIDRQVRVFKPSDREAYMAGGNVPTEFVVQR
jgi:hypothetical protein